MFTNKKFSLVKIVLFKYLFVTDRYSVLKSILLNLYFISHFKEKHFTTYVDYQSLSTRNPKLFNIHRIHLFFRISPFLKKKKSI